MSDLQGRTSLFFFECYLHKHGIVVGIAELFHVIGDTLVVLIVEDIVDSQGRLATKGMHPSASAFLEAV